MRTHSLSLNNVHVYENSDSLCMYVRTHSLSLPHTNIRTWKHKHIHKSCNKYVCISTGIECVAEPIRKVIHKRTHTHTHTRTHILTYTHTHIYTHAHTHIHTNTHAHNYKNTHTHTYTHTHTHKHTHKHIHTYTRTHTHFHILRCQVRGKTAQKKSARLSACRVF